jgi:hypothetical protein
MNVSEGASANIAIAIEGLTITNDRRRSDRRLAVEDITLAARVDQKTLIYGIPVAGKSAIMDAIRHPERYPGHVSVRADIQELSLKDSRRWTARQFAEKYDRELRPDAYLLVDDAYDAAMPYLAGLDRGMLVLAGVDGHDCFHRFDRLLYLSDGKILFDGTPREFFDWVKRTRPTELQSRLADYLVDSGGELPGCPDVDS